MTAQLINNDDLFGLNPEVNLKTRLAEIVLTATNLDVTCEENFRKITSLYAESKSWEKQIELARKAANQPDQDRINVRNDKAKELLNPLKQIQIIAKKKADGYQALLEQRKRDEREKIEQAVEMLGLVETPYVPPVDKSIRGDGAIVYTRTVRKFRIVDLSKVPLKYLQINEDAVEHDIKLGVNSIDGIEIYEEKQTQ